MRTLYRILATSFIVIALVCVANADEYESTVIYTADDSYFIEIPETIIAGEPAYITASEVNIADGKTISVGIGSVDYIQIYNQKDTSKPLNVYFEREDGTRANASTPLATFDSDGSREFTAVVNDTTNALAGEYSGRVMFEVYCE